MLLLPGSDVDFTGCFCRDSRGGARRGSGNASNGALSFPPARRQAAANTL